MDAKLRLAALLFAKVRRPIEEMDLDDIREARKGLPDSKLVTRVLGGLAEDVTTHDRTIPGAVGPLPARIYTPHLVDPDRPVVVYFHGGGWVLGTLDQGDWLCSQVASRVGTQVVSIDYRLAPEDPFPAGVEDCVAATNWVAAHADAFGSTTGAVAVMGDSAGGNLSAVVSLRARTTGTPAISHQVLLYPGVDATMSHPSAHELAHAPILTRAGMAAFVAHYLGTDGDPRHPDVSPLFADDHSGLPPALVITAEHDPLKDEGAAYVDALVAAGVPTRFTEYRGMVHGFVTFPGLASGAPQAVDEIVGFLSDRPGAGGTLVATGRAAAMSTITRSTP